MIDGKEDVARALFSPRMIVDGVLQPETFKLRSSISEDYLSVMRMIFASWMDDIKNIPQRKNRILYGYATLNVKEIRDINLKNVTYDVKDCSLNSTPSHAGIFIIVNGEKLVGGQTLKSVQDGVSQDFLLLAIQRELVEIAQKTVCKL
ncbi:MAG: hypothetical protein J6T70_08445 [Bacteroidales bacterium]|nr:hypothetical protein [Bacteroidales bacterium]